jgi:cytochrome c biogenesis protein CcmG, thiol:disulfide interchange protein DsbE
VAAGLSQFPGGASPFIGRALPSLIGLALLSGCSLQSPLAAPNQSLVTVGKPAPNWSGTDLNGKPIALDDFRGHPLLINFWASWCGPCRAEQPALNHVAADYAGQGFRVVGIDIRDNIDQARIFRDEFKVTYPSLFDQAAHLGYAYQVDAPPSSIFVNAKGLVVFKITGELSEDNFRQIIKDRLLTRQ